MRKAKSGKRDMSKPVDLKVLAPSDGDCFGKEWESTHPECVRCSEYDVCLVLTKKTRKPENKFLDEFDWGVVPWDDIKQMIKEGGVSMAELREAVMLLAGPDIDPGTVRTKINNFCIQNHIKVDQDGHLFVR